MKIKKNLVTFVLLLCTFTFIFSSIKNTNEDAYASNLEDNYNIYDYYCITFNKVKDYNEYAGIYIDNNKVIICVTENTEYFQGVVKDLTARYFEDKFFDFDIYQVVTVKFNDKYINSIFCLLKENMLAFNIRGLGIQYKKNKILIEIDEFITADKINSFLGNNVKDIDYEVIEYSQHNESMPNVEAISGHKLRYTSGLIIYSGTIGFNAYDNETGRYGIVTNYHVAPPNKNMYYQNGLNLIGKMSKGSEGDTIDASFVPFNNNALRRWYETSDVHADGYDTEHITSILDSFPEGLALKKYGITTLLTSGEILISNYSFTMNSIQYNDCVKYSCASRSGDSGGPFGYLPRSGGFRIGGINFAGPVDPTLNYGIGCKINNILSELNVKVVSYYGNIS